MLNFIDKMEEVGEFYRSDEFGIRNFNQIDTQSGYKISVQCSRHHYCTPAKVSEQLDEYDSFEVAMFYKETFVYPKILDEFQRKEELDRCRRGKVFAFVPKDLVEDLFNYLNEPIIEA